MSKHRWLFAWGLGSIAVGAASLLVPLYVVSLGGTPLDLGLLGAAAALIGAPGGILWGRLANRTANPRRVADRFTPTLTLYFLAVVLCFTGFSTFFAPLPLFLADVGFSSDVVFGLYLVASLGSAAFYTAAGTLSGTVDLRVLHGAAIGSRAVTMPLVAVVGTALAAGLLGTVITGLLFAAIGVSWAVIAVTAGTIVTRIAPANVRGEALGVYTALSTLAGGIGSVGGGALASGYGFTVAFVAGGVVILAGAGLVVALRASHRGRDRPPPRFPHTRRSSVSPCRPGRRRTCGACRCRTAEFPRASAGV